MRLPLIITSILIVAILLGAFLLFVKSGEGTHKAINWNLELTKPLDYEIDVKNVSFIKEGIEMYREVSMNSLQGWTGASGGRVLHNKQKEFLPDSIKLTWEEEATGIFYYGSFKFPREKVLDLWNHNYLLLQEQWGHDYPRGQLSLKLGLAPGGLAVLWLADLDVNTSGFAIEVESFAASIKGVDSAIITPTSINQTRYGFSHFYPPLHDNVVSIYVIYYNGEENSINIKKQNKSILEKINADIGWGLTRMIVVHWFDEDNLGYKSTYEVDLQDESIKNAIQNFRSNTKLIYLLDREIDDIDLDRKSDEQYVFQLKEVKRELMKK